MKRTSTVISVEHLGKRYRSVVAVDDVSLEVHEGEIFGLIGPNGAGKTTTMECIEGLRAPDHGTIRVLGLDPQRDAAALRQQIGVQHQEAQLQKRINVWEALDLWARLYPRAVGVDDLWYFSMNSPPDSIRRRVAQSGNWSWASGRVARRYF